MFKKCLVKSHEDVGKDLSWALGKNIESDYDSDWDWHFTEEGRILSGKEESEVTKAFKDYYGQFGEIEYISPSYRNVVIVFKEEV